MKLNYREKWFLLVFSVIVIVIIFCAWPIRSLRKKIAANEVTRKTVLQEYDDKHKQIAQIPDLEKQIEQLYSESSEYSKIFIESKANEEVDQYVADILNNAAEYVCKNMKENAVEVSGMNKIENQKEEELKFSVNIPLVMNYPILQAADINGNLMETEDKELYARFMNATKIAALKPETVEVHTQQVELNCTKMGFLKFLDDLAKIDTGLKVSKIEVLSPEFTYKEAAAGTNSGNKQGFSTVKMEIKYYTMQKIAKPAFMDK